MCSTTIISIPVARTCRWIWRIPFSCFPILLRSILFIPRCFVAPFVRSSSHVRVPLDGDVDPPYASSFLWEILLLPSSSFPVPGWVGRSLPFRSEGIFLSGLPSVQLSLPFRTRRTTSILIPSPPKLPPLIHPTRGNGPPSLSNHGCREAPSPCDRQ